MIIPSCVLAEISKQAGSINYQGMITSSGEILIESCEDCPTVMMYRRRFSVKELGSTHYASTKRLPDRLMTETYTKDRNFSAQMFDDVQRYSGIIRRARTRRNDYAIGFQFGINLVDCHFVVTTHLNFFAQFAKILNQVVSE